MSTLPPNNKTQITRKKMTTLAFRQKKERGEPITMLTGYDYPTAQVLDQAGIDAILVGDSLGMVVLGYENTLPVTMDEMLASLPCSSPRSQVGPADRGYAFHVIPGFNRRSHP